MVKINVLQPSEITIEVIDGEIKIGVKEISNVENDIKKCNVDILNEFCDTLPKTSQNKRFHDFYMDRLLDKKKPWSGKFDVQTLYTKWNEKKR